MNPISQANRQPRATIVDQSTPSPTLFFQTALAYQRSAALKAAVELDLFTAIADGAANAEAIATRCRASERGIRILCDYLVINGFLTKEAGRYLLTHDSFVFLNRHSPAYVGSAVEFMLSREHVEPFLDLASIVRSGTRDGRLLDPDNPMWTTFARAMAPLAAMSAGLLVDLLDLARAGRIRVLDVAAGHGLFGITIAKQNGAAEIVALDWPTVLQVAKGNAESAGVAKRYRTIEGDAMTVDLGGPYDLVLLPNFLHHFDQATCTAFLRRVRDALEEGGQVATLEFVPDEDRITPPIAAAFAITMLGETPAGDAYTFSEYQRMFNEAGLRDVQLRAMPPAFQRVVTARR